MKSVQQSFKEIYKKLHATGNLNPHLEAGWLLEKFVGLDSATRIAHPETELTQEQDMLLQQAVERRIAGEPLAHILGEKDFYGHKFIVTKDVLIPRPETELLVDWAANWLEKNHLTEPTILDLGTGSGCVGISLLKIFPGAQLTALDISKPALEIAKANAKNLKTLDRTEFILLDAAKAGFLLKSFDLVVANPPYIDLADSNVEDDVRKFEPHLALFSGRGGLAAIDEWLSTLPKILKPKAAVGFEIGHQQGDTVLRMFSDLGIFSQQYVVKDYAKHDRFVCGER
jgi:release factor glutamine methyltransferase